MSELENIDLGVLSDVTDKALATARECLLQGKDGTGVVAYVQGNDWRATLVYGTHADQARRQAAYRILGRIGQASGADVAVNVLDTFVNLPGAEVEADEDPQAFEALVAQIITPDAFITPVLVQRYGRDDFGELTFEAPIPAEFQSIGTSPKEFLDGWAKAPKKPKTLGGYCYELAHNVVDLHVGAPDADEWVVHLNRLKDKN